MRPKALFFVVLILQSIAAFSQDKRTFLIPDFKNIKKETNDRNSSNYYPRLLARYMANDTTLSTDEMRMLYYGTFFNDIPHDTLYESLHFTDSIRVLHTKTSYTDDDRRNLVRYYLADYKNNPFDLVALNALYSLYTHLKDPLAAVYDFKLGKLVRIIYETGDGTSVETAFYINSVSDEYAMLNIMGYNSNGSQTLVANKCDYLEVAGNTDHIKGFYFNVEQIFEGYKKMFNDVDLKKSLNEMNKKK